MFTLVRRPKITARADLPVPNAIRHTRIAINPSIRAQEQRRAKQSFPLDRAFVWLQRRAGVGGKGLFIWTDMAKRNKIISLLRMEDIDHATSHTGSRPNVMHPAKTQKCIKEHKGGTYLFELLDLGLVEHREDIGGGSLRPLLASFLLLGFTACLCARFSCKLDLNTTHNITAFLQAS